MPTNSSCKNRGAYCKVNCHPWVTVHFCTRHHCTVSQQGSPNIVLFDRTFPFVMGPMKSPNPGHAVTGFYKKTHCYTLFCGKMPIPYRNINR